jgi:hypothetical protein
MEECAPNFARPHTRARSRTSHALFLGNLLQQAAFHGATVSLIGDSSSRVHVLVPIGSKKVR